jgi:hypothetical protein
MVREVMQQVSAPFDGGLYELSPRPWRLCDVQLPFASHCEDLA